MQATPSHVRAAVIGGGPAGLMAAEVLTAGGVAVDVFDAMPSPGRKLLLAGVGGLNLTHAEDYATFVSRFGPRAKTVRGWLDGFTPDDLRNWAAGLGVETFIGSSRRVFPVEMKAAPLLRAWLKRLRSNGMRLHVRHRWFGWDDSGALRFAVSGGEIRVRAAVTVLALGGGSWAKLGSDGAWTRVLAAQGVAIEPLAPSNCGFDARLSPHLRERFAGVPVKTVALVFTDAAGVAHRRQGELMVSADGLEGGLIYAFSASLRELITQRGEAQVCLDLLPDLAPERVLAALMQPRGRRSLSSHLQSRLRLKGVKTALLYEVLSREGMRDPHRLAATIKALPLTLTAPRPIDEAISSAGGVRIEGLDRGLMLKGLPGVFCAGEMLDWEAPTGGYLLTACLASGRVAGKAALERLRCG